MTKTQPKKLSKLSAHEFMPYLKLTQNEAARKLGVSKSTLKRRFYELKLGKAWPNHNQETKRKMRTKAQFDVSLSTRISVKNLLNNQSQEEKYIPEGTLETLSKLYNWQKVMRNAYYS